MSFWNKKKKTTVLHVQSSLDKELLTNLEKAIRLSTENRNRDTANLIRSNQELSKSLNNASKEFRRSKS